MPGVGRRRDGRDRWRGIKCTGDVPSGRIGHSMVVGEDGFVYLYGGVNEESQHGTNYLADFYRYDFKTKVWTRMQLTGTHVPCGRAFHSAVMYQRHMLVFGGCNGRGRFNETYSICTQTGECELLLTTGERPSTRYCHSAVVHNGRMIIFGGKCGGRNSNKRLDDMFTFDIKTKSWSIIGIDMSLPDEIPSSRSAHTAVVYFDKMLMFGGRNAAGKCCEDLYEFSFITNQWRRLDATVSLFVRARHSIVLHNDKLITFAGWNGKKKLNDMFQYNLDTHTWSIIHENDENDPNLPCRRECHAAVVMDDKMVLFGGRFRGVFMNDLFECDLEPTSLKDVMRAYILKHEKHFDYAHYGLPDDLVEYLNMYKKRALPFSPRDQPPRPAAAQRSSKQAARAESATTTSGDGKKNKHGSHHHHHHHSSANNNHPNNGGGSGSNGHINQQ